MSKYFQKYPNNENKAITHYHLNIMVSESFYPILSILEVSLRNSLNRELTTFFGTENWHLEIELIPTLNSLTNDINTAKKHILNRNESITASKVTAELTLGFWVKLLNTKYEQILWKPLRKAFPYLEKINRQRKTVSAPLNKIRNFRNRVFHHEPISWNFSELENTHKEIIQVMGWINKDLPLIIAEMDRVENVLKSAKIRLNE
ncbi:hypothetical protein [Arcicella rosea]|uniref:Abi-like protein n=1 Tax=Arcicella rosea TaxID=502909 RepID=A0A841EUN4_9BACT|nr:hypothetical protein [Arcicella rosea]MBB6004010.1 hypothetical protein [Arcicella rosea]